MSWHERERRLRVEKEIAISLSLSTQMVSDIVPSFTPSEVYAQSEGAYLALSQIIIDPSGSAQDPSLNLHEVRPWIG